MQENFQYLYWGLNPGPSDCEYDTQPTELSELVEGGGKHVQSYYC